MYALFVIIMIRGFLPSHLPSFADASSSRLPTKIWWGRAGRPPPTKTTNGPRKHTWPQKSGQKERKKESPLIRAPLKLKCESVWVPTNGRGKFAGRGNFFLRPDIGWMGGESGQPRRIKNALIELCKTHHVCSLTHSPFSILLFIWKICMECRVPSTHSKPP